MIGARMTKRDIFEIVQIKGCFFKQEAKMSPHLKLLHQQFPEVLVKAFFDHFYYSILLTDGTKLHFTDAEPTHHDDFIKIKNFGDERWLEVNIKQIVLICDNENKYQSVYTW